MKKQIAIAGFAALALVYGAESVRFDHQVRNMFFSGFAGNKEQLAKGMEICEKVLAENPNHAEALVWHGGGLFFQSGDLFRKGDYENGTKLNQKGIAEMDRAVELAPDSVGVRIPRGASYITASRFYPKDMGEPLLKKGLEDYEHSYKLQMERKYPLGDHAKGELLFGMADAKARLGNTAEAKTMFELIKKELPGSDQAARADKWLTTGKLTPAESQCLGCHVSR